MYYEGVLPRDNAQAAECYRKAAEQGLAKAQTNLGVMHAVGLGVPRDDLAAYMWFSLAAPDMPDKNQRNLQALEKRMTPEQIAEGKRRADEWRKQHLTSH